MKQVVLFGAGKSATVLIDYLLQESVAGNWKLTLVDANLQMAKEKIGNHRNGTALSFDINDEKLRAEHIEKADLVLSLLPPALHFLIAKDCIRFKKNLLTASYVDAQMKSLREEIIANDLLFLCEMGLDPGIDHMSAKKMIDEIEKEGGVISSFHSHCGGLVAPENDDNPWHYKISWNPRNVVNAGKAGAIYKQHGQIVEQEYAELFAERRFVSFPNEIYCWYPNRDSISYIELYGLHHCDTFIRTTLRHPDFMYGWKNIVELNLTDDQITYETKDQSLMDFFRLHMDRNGFSEWLETKLQEHFHSTKTLLNELVNLVDLEKKAEEKGIEQVEDFMVVDDKGDLQQIDIDELKVNAAATLADKMHDASLTLKQLFFLGMDDAKTLIPKEKATAADVLQFCLEQKLVLKEGERDMVLMMHEIEFVKEDRHFKRTATLVLEGKDDLHTAMAKTVGLPLGIAAKFILNGKINAKGLLIPTSPHIYNPVLNELEKNGIRFFEEETEIEST